MWKRSVRQACLPPEALPSSVIDMCLLTTVDDECDDPRAPVRARVVPPRLSFTVSACAVLCVGARVTMTKALPIGGTEQGGVVMAPAYILQDIAPPTATDVIHRAAFCRHIASWIARACAVHASRHVASPSPSPTPSATPSLARPLPRFQDILDRLLSVSSSAVAAAAVGETTDLLTAMSSAMSSVTSIPSEVDVEEDVPGEWCRAAVQLMHAMFERVNARADLDRDWSEARGGRTGSSEGAAMKKAAAMSLTQHDVTRAAADIAASALSASGRVGVAEFRSNPYVLYRNTPPKAGGGGAWGDHIVACDAFARMYGLADQRRAAEMVAVKLASLMADGGHTCYPLDALVRATLAKGTLAASNGWDADAVRAAVVSSDGDLFVLVPPGQPGQPDHRSDPVMVYRASAHALETAVAIQVRRMRTSPSVWTPRICASCATCATGWDTDVSAAVLAADGSLSDEQKGAALFALGSRSSDLMVLTGFPGTGKSRVVNAIRVACAALGLTSLALAPTGKAAHRLGSGAATLHRALGIFPVASLSPHVRPAPSFLDADMVIVDETSMLDARMAAALLAALDPARTRLLLVGDAHQLPSVDWGDVLAQLLASPPDVVPRRCLTEVFRQGTGTSSSSSPSPVWELARAVAHGGPLRLREWKDSPGGVEHRARSSGVAWVRIRAQGLAGGGVDAVCSLTRDLYRAHAGELQILTPSRRHGVHVDVLNDALRSEPGARAPRALSVGDRVVITRNRYAKTAQGDIDPDASIFNGECGTVEVLEDGADGGAPGAHGAQCVGVRLGARLVWVAPPEFDFSYAMTVHKVQGSEFPAVAVVLSAEHGRALNRAILYTAVTRAKRRLYIVSDKETLATAVMTLPPPRFSGLATLLSK